MIFKIRAEVLDIKSFRQYKYDDDLCRLCSNGIESPDHIVNSCTGIPRYGSEHVDVTSEDVSHMRTIVRRTHYFLGMVDGD